jgi:hypothetical protein
MADIPSSSPGLLLSLKSLLIPYAYGSFAVMLIVLGAEFWNERKDFEALRALCDERINWEAMPVVPENSMRRGVRAMRENQSIIRRDACHPPSSWEVCRQPIQVATPA